MNKFLILGVSAMALSACSGSTLPTFGPGGGGGGDGVDTPIIEGDTCSGDVLAVSYDADTDTLRITGTPFDETPLPGTYVRADTINNLTIPFSNFDYGSDNLNGFAAYENDDGFAINPYFALNQTSADGSVTVGQSAVADGYRSYGYGGYWIRVNEAASLPGAELAYYDGDFAGIIALQGDTGAASTIQLSEGDVFFEVDFTDGFIKGQTFGRTIDGDAAAEIVFDDVAFDGTTFSGNATSVGLDNNWEGTYAGAFTGANGETLGGVFITEQSNFSDDEDLTARETAIFIATKTPRVER